MNLYKIQIKVANKMLNDELNIMAKDISSAADIAMKKIEFDKIGREVMDLNITGASYDFRFIVSVSLIAKIDN